MLNWFVVNNIFEKKNVIIWMRMKEKLEQLFGSYHGGRQIKAFSVYDLLQWLQ